MFQCWSEIPKVKLEVSISNQFEGQHLWESIWSKNFFESLLRTLIVPTFLSSLVSWKNWFVCIYKHVFLRLYMFFVLVFALIQNSLTCGEGLASIAIFKSFCCNPDRPSLLTRAVFNNLFCLSNISLCITTYLIPFNKGSIEGFKLVTESSFENFIFVLEWEFW